MTKILRSAMVLAIFACRCASAQAPTQTNGNFVDLTVAPTPPATPTALKDPPSCPAGSGGGMNWAANPPVDAAPHTLKLEIVKLSNPKPSLGDGVTAEIRVTNTDAKPFTIPWSADPAIVPVDPSGAVQWQQGEIDLTLRSLGSSFTLASPANRLYGVASKPASLKTLAPGDSAIVRLEFKIQSSVNNDEYPVTAGKRELSAAWNAAQRSLRSTECTYASEWSFVNVKSDSVPFEIEVSPGAGPAPETNAFRSTSALALGTHITLTAGTDGVEFDEAISAVLLRVQSAVIAAMRGHKLTGAKGDLTVRFAVLKNGMLAPEGVAVVKTSMNDETRDAIVKAITEAGRFSALPAAFSRKSIAVQIEFWSGGERPAVTGVPKSQQHEPATTDLRPTQSNLGDADAAKDDRFPPCENNARCCGFADGYVEDPPGGRQQIRTEVLAVSNSNPKAGDTLEAKVRLQNADSRPIVIPWGSSATKIPAAEKGAYEWEAGWFELWLTSPKGRAQLADENLFLIAVDSIPASSRTLMPGEAITVQVRFRLIKIAAYYDDVSQLGTPVELSAEWKEKRRTYSTESCMLGYFDHDFDDQLTPLVLDIVPDSNATSAAAAPVKSTRSEPKPE